MNPMTCLLMLTLALVACRLSSAQEPVPLHVWHFDEATGDEVLDASEDFIDLELCEAQRVEGLFGGAVQTGEGGYVQGPGVGHMVAGSIECWAKLLEELPGQMGVVGLGNRFGEKNDFLLLGRFPSPEEGKQMPFGLGMCYARWQGAIADAAPSLNEWHHLVGTWAADGQKLYVDGELVAESPERMTVSDHAAIFLGGSSWGRTLKAIIDEVRIYAVALSPEVVAAHFESRAYVAQPPQPQSRLVHYGAREGAALSAADFASDASFTCGIQEAIDALPREGGEVYLAPGRYLLRRSVWLRNNVTLRGAGACTTLTRPPDVQVNITASAEQGASEVQVADPAGLEVGCDVSVYADKIHGWYSTTTPIVAIEGNAITLSRGLNKSVDPEAHAGVINYFPIITAEHKHHLSIRDLCIDGNAGTPNTGIKDFTWGAIHLYDCADCTISGCWIRNYVSDGVSVQAGSRVTVTDCLVENCRGHGLHPGTGLQDSVWSSNISRLNTNDGLFFCHAVRHSVVSNNILADNLGSGIGHLGGGGAGDKYNVVSGNTCVRNGRWGIHVYDGTDNVVTGNVCLNNSQSSPGKYPGIGVIKTTDTVISGNRCLDDQDTKTQKHGIAESEESDHNLITGNLCRGNLDAGVVTSGANTTAADNMQ